MKIDITKMEGYREDMTAEEKLALYSSYEFTPDYTGYVKKMYSTKSLRGRRAVEKP